MKNKAGLYVFLSSLFFIFPSFSLAQTTCSDELNLRLDSYGDNLHGELKWTHLRNKYKDYQVLAWGIPLTTIDAASFYFQNARNLQTVNPGQQAEFNQAVNSVDSIQQIHFSLSPSEHSGRRLEAIGLPGQCGNTTNKSAAGISKTDNITPRSATENNGSENQCGGDLELRISTYGPGLHGELSWNHRRLRYRQYKILAWGLEFTTVDASSFYISNARNLRTTNPDKQREFDQAISGISTFDDIPFSLRPQNYQGQYLDQIYPGENCPTSDQQDLNNSEDVSDSTERVQGLDSPPLSGQWQLN